MDGGSDINYPAQPSYGEGMADALKAQVELLTGKGDFAEIAPSGLAGLVPLEGEVRKLSAQADTAQMYETLLGRPDYEAYVRANPSLLAQWEEQWKPAGPGAAAQPGAAPPTPTAEEQRLLDWIGGMEEGFRREWKSHGAGGLMEVYSSDTAVGRAIRGMAPLTTQPGTPGQPYEPSGLDIEDWGKKQWLEWGQFNKWNEGPTSRTGGLVELLGSTKDTVDGRRPGFDEDGNFLGLTVLGEDLREQTATAQRGADLADVEANLERFQAIMEEVRPETSAMLDQAVGVLEEQGERLVGTDFAIGDPASMKALATEVQRLPSEQLTPELRGMAEQLAPGSRAAGAPVSLADRERATQMTYNTLGPPSKMTGTGRASAPEMAAKQRGLGQQMDLSTRGKADVLGGIKRESGQQMDLSTRGKADVLGGIKRESGQRMDLSTRSKADLLEGIKRESGQRMDLSTRSKADLLEGIKRSAPSQLTGFADVGSAGLRADLQAQAQADLAAGRGLSQRQREDALNLAREGWEARGRVRDPAAVVAEVEAVMEAQGREEARRRAFAQDVLGQESALRTGELGRGMAQAQYNIGQDVARGEANIARETEAQRYNIDNEIRRLESELGRELTQQEFNIVQDTVRQEANIGRETESQRYNIDNEIRRLESELGRELTQQEFNIIQDTVRQEANIGRETESQRYNIDNEIRRLESELGRELTQQEFNLVQEAGRQEANIGRQMQSQGVNIQNEVDRLEGDIGRKLTAQEFNILQDMSKRRYNIENIQRVQQYNIDNEIAREEANLGRSLTVQELNVMQDAARQEANLGRQMQAGQFNILGETERQEAQIGRDLGAQQYNIGQDVSRQEANIGRQLTGGMTDVGTKLDQQRLNEQLRQQGILGYLGGATQLAALEQQQQQNLDPFSAILNRPTGQGFQMGQQMYGSGQYGLTSGPQYLNPEAGLGYIQNMATNAASMYGAEQAAQATRQAGMMNMIGSIGGAATGAAIGKWG